MYQIVLFIFSFLKVCDFLFEDNTTLVWDNEQQVPFAYRANQWVGFDDERSLGVKVNNKLVLKVINYVYLNLYYALEIISISSKPIIFF